MGNVISKIAQRISSTRVSKHYPMPRLSEDYIMAPDPDEMASRRDSPSSFDSTATITEEQDMSLLWPYASKRPTVTDQPPEDNPPLKSRRPALYDEYWGGHTRCSP